jgi:fructuronate reductase
MDGSQKLPQRWLNGALENLEQQRPVTATALGVAAWMRFVRGGNDRGQRWPVDDPLAERLAACHRRQATAVGFVDALFGIEAIFPPALVQYHGFRAQVLGAYDALEGDRADD